MSWVPPRRITSTPATVTVQQESTGDVWETLMGQYVADSSGWTVNAGTPSYCGFKHFECDPANRGSPDFRHLSDYYPHSVASGVPRGYGLCDYSTDGYKTGGADPLPPGTTPTGEAFHPAINWAGTGCYDPVKKRVMWMTKGTGSEECQWPFNTLAIYRLGHNETEGWTSVRGFRATTFPDAGNVYGLPMTHFFYNNAIDVVGRTLYKKQFQTTNGIPYGQPGYTRGPSGPFFAFDLDSDISTAVLGADNVHLFKPSILAPSWDGTGAGCGPGAFIPKRGVAGTYWYSNMGPRIAEYDPAIGTGQRADWVTIAETGCLPKMHSNYNMIDSIGIMCHNPRALGGEGAVLICGGSRGSAGVMTVRNVNYYMVSTPATGAWLPGNAGAIKIYEHSGEELPPSFGFGGGVYGQMHICADPVGDGWLLFPSATGQVPPVPIADRVVWKLAGTPGATWQRTTHAIPPIGVDYGVPAPPSSGPVTPIEELGVAWLVTQRPFSAIATTPRAWLYKP